MSYPVKKASGRFLSLVVPVFNETESIETFIQSVSAVLSPLQELTFEIVFVNDGSTDGTLETLIHFQQEDPRVRVVDLTRNFGKEAALSAGLHAARGDAVIPIDIDLQDPPELIPSMLERWSEGYEVVLARRTCRTTDSFTKRLTAAWFYRIHNRLSDTKIPENVGDFRLMDRSVIDALKTLPESRRFMKGLFAWCGFKSVTVDYSRPARHAGVTKFNAWRLWNFALEGITSFGTAPLRIWSYFGFGVAFFSFLFALYIIIKVVIFGIDVPGYASLMVVSTFLGGLQLLGIGVLGEYLGRVYLESKRRPVFLVRKTYGFDADTV
jgi:glycosyltransferase involved in cell wall biosynthesis